MEENKVTLNEFLSNEDNRKRAEEHCLNLWIALSQGERVEAVEEQIYTTTDVVKITNLSHSKTKQVLSLLKVFGLIEIVEGNHKFRFLFKKSTQLEVLRASLQGLAIAIRNDLESYNSVYSSLTQEERKEFLSTMEIQHSVIEIMNREKDEL